MTLLNPTVQIMSGVTGSNALAGMLRQRTFGVIGKSTIGAIGGLIGAPALTALLGGSEGTVYLIRTAAGSETGGAALMGTAAFASLLLRR